ncbi:MAG: hypothetical protein E6G50_01450 [Actinobacteria bacterium]|nr:MAG: hypothetical protein E6G50_01450 [Actinomycetota bacterium]
MARVLAVSIFSLALSLPRPDLLVSHVGVVYSSGALQATVVVANPGAAPASPTVVSYRLGGKRLATRRIHGLRAGSTTRIRATLAVPASVSAGSYRLRVCVDATHRIREVNERNNCRVATASSPVQSLRPAVAACDGRQHAGEQDRVRHLPGDRARR